MDLLKRENWFIWFVLIIFGEGAGIIALSALLDSIDTHAWYTKWYFWLMGFACFLLPGFIMLLVFMIELTCISASKLKLPGKELYLSPYIWLVMVIIPFIGWLLFILAILYLIIGIIVMLYKGAGEEYINK